MYQQVCLNFNAIYAKEPMIHVVNNNNNHHASVKSTDPIDDCYLVHCYINGVGHRDLHFISL